MNENRTGIESPDPPDSRPRMGRLLLAAAKWTMGLVVFPILVGAAVLSFFANSTSLHSYLIRTLQNQASEKLGVPVVLQNFTLHMASLSVDLYGLTVSGANGHPNPALLQVQHIQAGVKVVSIVRRKWYLDTLRIDRPIIQILVDSNGTSNIPTIKSTGSSDNNNAIFDLGIRRAIIDGGEVYYNNEPATLAADMRDVNLNASFNDLLQKYSGSIGYSDGHLVYGSIKPPTHSVHVQFDATPTTLHLSPAELAIGNSRLTLNATITNYGAPIVQAQYTLVADGAQIAQAFHNSSIPRGVVTARGNAQYRQQANRALLDSITVNGDLSSSRLDLRVANTRSAVSNLLAHYSMDSGNAVLGDLRASLFGGELTAQGTMKNVAGDSHSQITAALHNVSLAQIRRTFARADAAPNVTLAGILSAKANASWGKTVDDLVAHADATIDSQVFSAPATTEKLQATALPIESAKSAGAIPVRGEVHATYMAKGQRLAVEKSSLQTVQTSLAADGVISSNSSLNLQFHAGDLREIESIANLFRTSPDGKPANSLGLTGAASFQGNVKGSTSAPHLTGELASQNLQFNGITWKVFRANVDVSPAEVSLSQADLEPASGGKLTFNASVGLRNWTYADTSPLQILLNATHLDVADLVKLSGQQIPVAGTLNANIALHGTQLDPVGHGNATINRATAYGEPITSAELTFHGAENDAHADLVVRAPAGSVESKFVVQPLQRTYTAELSSSGIQLEKLQAVSKKDSSISGIVSISAKGHGSFDNPQADALIAIPSLMVQDQSVKDIHLQLNVADHLATANLTSMAVGTSVQAHGKVSLTGDYIADATLDTQSIPLGPLLAAYAPDEAANVTGQTEIHATLHGPLKDWQRLEAHATIPVFKLAYTDSIQLAADSPIRIDMKDGVINVQPSSIRGTETELQFHGTIPTAADKPASLTLVGTINLHLAQLFDPDLNTSGQIKLNVNSTSGKNGLGYGGTIDIVDANLSSASLPVALQHANGSLTLSNDRISVSSFKGVLGGGTLAAQGGIVLKPATRFDVGMSAQGVRMLYPQGMRESMDANLRFTGSPDRALLGGNITVTDISFTRAFDLNDFIRQFIGGVEAPPSRGFAENVALNLSVRSSNNVNLISRALSVGGSAALQVRGSLAEPVILGRANLTGGDVILNSKRFVLTGGTVQFVNPSQTEPVVNLSLTTTIQQYNISLRFEGPIDQLRTQYTSDPSLPSADIINLLAFGKTTEAAANDTTPTNQAAQSLVASQVSSEITSRVSKIAGISQLSINPVLPNSNVSGQAGANITIQQRVTGNLFVTYSTNVASTQSQTIQGQYQFSPRVSISVTGDPNGGFAIDTLIKRTW
jgi:translocation and assembly module TamB